MGKAIFTCIQWYNCYCRKISQLNTLLQRICYWGIACHIAFELYVPWLTFICSKMFFCEFITTGHGILCMLEMSLPKDNLLSSTSKGSSVSLLPLVYSVDWKCMCIHKFSVYSSHSYTSTSSSENFCESGISLVVCTVYKKIVYISCHSYPMYVLL